MDLISRQDAIDAVAFGIIYTKVFDKETCKVKVKELFGECNYALKTAIDRIKELPSAEPKIIKCKDCEYFRPFSDGWNGCYNYAISVSPDHFCSSAERRTDVTLNRC